MKMKYDSAIQVVPPLAAIWPFPRIPYVASEYMNPARLAIRTHSHTHQACTATYFSTVLLSKLSHLRPGNPPSWLQAEAPTIAKYTSFTLIPAPFWP